MSSLSLGPSAARLRRWTVGLLATLAMLGGERAWSAPAGPLTEQEVAGFVDAEMARLMTDAKIPGAAVAVVQGDRIVFARGYGYADLAQRRPVRADRTLFRMASLSKLITWTAAMQQVELGRIDLHRDVNAYLPDWKIPDRSGGPVTMAALMSHTAGFEDWTIGPEWVRSPKDFLPLSESLRRYLPARVRPEGDRPSYSNYSASLAGLAVANVSGRSYDAYVAERIFRPLAMTRSTFAEPLPPALAPDLAVSYAVDGEQFEPKAFEFTRNDAPASSLSATVVDMSRFMLAHLGEGRLGSAVLLRPETEALMQSAHYRAAPGMNGMAHGFYERRQNGLRLLMHGGDTLFQQSMLVLIPERRTGFIVVFNGAGDPRARDRFRAAFLDRFFPRVGPAPEPQQVSVSNLRRFAGGYRDERHSYTRLEMVLQAWREVEVAVTADGRALSADLGRGEERFVPIGALTFWSRTSNERLAFRPDASGRIATLFRDEAPYASFQHLRWYDRQKLHLAIVGLSILAALSRLAMAAWRLWRPLDAPKAARLARMALTICAACVLVFAIGFPFVLLSAGIEEIVIAWPKAAIALLAAPLIGLVALSAALGGFALSARGPGWTGGGRVLFAGQVAAFALFFLVLGYWNALGWRL